MNDADNEKLIYQPIPEFTKSEMNRAISENDFAKLKYVPLFASLYFDDREFAAEVCIRLASHTDFNVRGLAIESLGHLARIDKKLDKETVKPLIEKALLDESEFVREKADDAMDEIEFFLKWKFRK